MNEKQFIPKVGQLVSYDGGKVATEVLGIIKFIHSTSVWDFVIIQVCGTDKMLTVDSYDLVLESDI